MWTLRRADVGDAQAVALLHRRVVRSSLPFLPDLHTATEDRDFFCEYFFPCHQVWICEHDSQLVGYIGFREGWVGHLYVDPAYHRKGIGTALLAKAMSASPTLLLWVFQKNTQAIAFYEGSGFRLIEQTNGEQNDEREPDALLQWQRG